MYCNNLNKNLENTSKPQQIITCTNFKKNLENTNTLSKNSQQTFIRDTTKILDLFKNPITNSKKNVQKENVLIKKEEDDNTVTIKKDISIITDMNKMYVYYEYLIYLFNNFIY